MRTMPLRISSEADAVRWARRCALIARLAGASLLASPAAYAVDNDLDGVPEYGFLTPSAVSVSLDQVDRIYVVDMDGDNDLDLLVANETTISWVENSDGAGHFGSEHAITGPGENQRLADLVDLDGDGDLDILTNAIGIYPNNGLGNFGAFQLIVTPPYSDGRALGSDVDGDGDGDVVWRGATRFSNLNAPGTGWYNNTDGAGTMGPLQLFARGWPDPGPSHVIGDLDSDGDPDVASFDPFGSDWYANTDGLGTFGAAQTIPESTANLNQGGPISMEGETADIDGDGDTDLLFTWRGSQLSPYPYLWYDQVTWYEKRRIRRLHAPFSSNSTSTTNSISIRTCTPQARSFRREAISTTTETRMSCWCARAASSGTRTWTAKALSAACASSNPTTPNPTFRSAQAISTATDESIS